jgi:DNA (cytosine-5)-methyltransferase 1
VLSAEQPNQQKETAVMDCVELFSGIGCFRLAADRLLLKTLWANDICPRACQVYRNRFGTSELVEGSILDHANEIPAHDLLTGGFPCQPFSSAGKKKGIHDPRGTLLQAVVEIIKARQPAYFILENVKRLLTMERGFHFATILSSLAEINYDIEWRLLNAMHFGLPQNRQRVFVVGIRRDQETEHPSDFPRIRLASKEDLENVGSRDLHRDEWKQIEKHGSRFANWGMASRGQFFAADLPRFSAASPLITVREVLQENVADEFDFTKSTLQWLPKNTHVNRLVQGVEILSNQGGGARMGYTIFGIDGVAPTLTSTTSRHYERYKIGELYRRLTNIEYARIQGFPDDHCSACSVYDQYALFGNAVPPPMAQWVMKRLVSDGFSASKLGNVKKQQSLFDYAN